MSEAVDERGDSRATLPPGSSARTAGQVLRTAREAAGMHVESLAMALKVPVHKLEALEADRHDQLPDMVFVRALASSVCRTLRLDPVEVLGLLPQTDSPRLNEQPQGLNTPVKPGAGVSSAMPFQRGPLWLIAALLLGAGLIWWLPGDLSSWSHRVVVSTAPVSVAPPAAIGGGEADASTGSSAAATPSLVLPGAGASVEVSPISGVTSAAASSGAAPSPMLSASTPPAIAPVAATNAAAAAPSSSDATAGGLVVFRARASSWIQVKDAGGNVVFQKTLAADESASVSGTLPLAVVVGRSDATEVLVRGKPFSLEGLARENVARFEIK